MDDLSNQISHRRSTNAHARQQKIARPTDDGRANRHQSDDDSNDKNDRG
jgi:hypothetical protein